jgi:hypothetical protein
MSLSVFFSRLGAPLRNPRWSEGAVRDSDGAVFLRVWQDEKFVENRRPYMRLTHCLDYADRPGHYGHQERIRHVQLVSRGAPCYMVMCRTDEPTATPRSLRCFNNLDVFAGAELRKHEGDFWLRIEARCPVEQVAISRQPRAAQASPIRQPAGRRAEADAVGLAVM